MDASFEADGPTLRDVVRICRRLDGLPLAVELAAARAKALPVASILGRLERSLELLTRGARDIPERHHSLRAAVSWSHDLLVPEEQAFFRRLAAFRGGWSLESTDAVTAASELGHDALDLTTSLLDKSLIRRHGDPNGEPRYEMLEVIREYAHERLRAADEEGQTMERHATWFLELAERGWHRCSPAVSEDHGSNQLATQTWTTCGPRCAGRSNQHRIETRDAPGRGALAGSGRSVPT